MSTPFPVNEDVPILVEFEVVPGTEEVSLTVEELKWQRDEARYESDA